MCFEDMTLFMNLPMDGDKCSQGFWFGFVFFFVCKKAIVLLVTLTPGICVYETDPVISDTSQQEQWSI